MSKTIHCSLSVRGALKWDRHMMRRACRTMTLNGRAPHNAEELRDALLELLAQGVEKIPMSECEGFDHKSGCPGHETRGAA